MAERLLQMGLDERFRGQFHVESAGTGALVGSPIEPRVAEYIRYFGASADGFSARQLTPTILSNADLVLTLAREHRSRVVEMSPASLRRTFTLREFARVLPSVAPAYSLSGSDRWRDAIPKAVRARSAGLLGATDDDVKDPYGRGDEVYIAMKSIIADAMSPLVAFG